MNKRFFNASTPIWTLVFSGITFCHLLIFLPWLKQPITIPSTTPIAAPLTLSLAMLSESPVAETQDAQSSSTSNAASTPPAAAAALQTDRPVPQESFEHATVKLQRNEQPREKTTSVGEAATELLQPERETTPETQPPIAQTVEPAQEESTQDSIAQQHVQTNTLLKSGETLTAATVGFSEEKSLQNARDKWQQALMLALLKEKRYPRFSRKKREQGASIVQFFIDRDGSVSGINLLYSSHFERLDREATDLIQRAAPLPPPPENTQEWPIELVIPIDFRLE